MTPEEKFRQEMWWLLQELETLRLYKNNGKVSRFVIGVRPVLDPDKPSPEIQEKALLKLENLGAIKIIDRKEEETTYGPNYIYFFDFLKKFEKIYNEYKGYSKQNLPQENLSPNPDSDSDQNQNSENKELKTAQTKQLPDDGDAKEKIKKITVVEMNNGRLLVAVNDNYDRTGKPRGNWWKIFVREIKEKNMKPETRKDVEEITKEMADYFNYNLQRCPIYMQGKYAPTNIIIWGSGYRVINQEIKMEVISEAKFLSRRAKNQKT